MSDEADEDESIGCNPLGCRCGKFRIPLRAVVAVMLHFLLQSNFNTRAVMNVAIVSMVSRSGPAENFTYACPSFDTVEDNTEKDKPFKWSTNSESLVLYAFYIGYSISQIPGGIIADKYGARYVILCSLVLTISSNVLLPICSIKYGASAAIILRTILGFAHGPCMPSIASMIAIWIPKKERNLYGGIAWGGTNLGLIISNFLTGIIIRWTSWEVPFYVWAIYSGVYFIFVLLFLYSFPETHPHISKQEVNFIKADHSKVKKKLKIPWKKILLNKPFWANVLAQFAHNYIYFQMITYQTVYLHDILRFDVQYAGIITGLSFLCLYLSSTTISITSKYFLKYFSTAVFDKFFGTFVSNLVSSILLLVVTLVRCHRVLAIVFYVLALSIKGFYFSTLPVNINTLSGNFSGVLFGVCNMIGGFGGIIGNHLIGKITANKTIEEWMIVYGITVVLSLVTTIFFFIFHSEKRQDFDYEENETRS